MYVKEEIMLIYKKLWELLKERNMKRTDLLKIMSSSTLAKLGKNEKVSLDVIESICEYLDCQPGEIVEYISDKQLETTKQQLEEMNQMLKLAEKMYPGLLNKIGEQLDKDSEAYKNFQKGDYFGSSIISDALDKKDPAE